MAEKRLGKVEPNRIIASSQSDTDDLQNSSLHTVSKPHRDTHGRESYLWTRRFSDVRQLPTLGRSALSSSTTCSRSRSRQHKYVSPTGDFPCRPARPRICLSIDGPTKSRPILALCRITRRAGLLRVRKLWRAKRCGTYRLMPAAKLQVATHTKSVPAS